MSASSWGEEKFEVRDQKSEMRYEILAKGVPLLRLVEWQCKLCAVIGGVIGRWGGQRV
jgi:hypothetical protein